MTSHKIMVILRQVFIFDVFRRHTIALLLAFATPAGPVCTHAYRFREEVIIKFDSSHTYDR